MSFFSHEHDFQSIFSAIIKTHSSNVSNIWLRSEGPIYVSANTVNMEYAQWIVRRQLVLEKLFQYNELHPQSPKERVGAYIEYTYDDEGGSIEDVFLFIDDISEHMESPIDYDNIPWYEFQGWISDIESLFYTLDKVHVHFDYSS